MTIWELLPPDEKIPNPRFDSHRVKSFGTYGTTFTRSYGKNQRIIVPMQSTLAGRSPYFARSIGWHSSIDVDGEKFVSELSVEESKTLHNDSFQTAERSYRARHCQVT